MRTRSLERAIPAEGGREPAVVRQRYDPETMADAATSILELAAAAPNQAALEGPLDPTGAPGGEHSGMFTRYLAEALGEAAASATYEEVLRRVAERLEYEELGQSPQITGEGATALFGPRARTR